MNNSKIKSALQDLIIRLQDAEKGYNEIIDVSGNSIINKWMKRYAQERHNMHRELEALSQELGGEPKVETSFLGNLHRTFLKMKINNVEAPNEAEAIIDEIERGATVLIEDYTKVLSDVEMPAHFVNKVLDQKKLVQSELSNLIELRSELTSVA